MGAETRAHAWLRPEDNEQCPLGLPEPGRGCGICGSLTVPQSQASLLTTAALRGTSDGWNFHCNWSLHGVWALCQTLGLRMS